MIRVLFAASVSGAATVLGFAPFDLFPLPFLTLAILFLLWRKAASPWQAALIGFLWGLGCFLAGVSWIYVSVHDVGGMAMPLALAVTLAFCGGLAIFPACGGWLYRRFATGAKGGLRDVLLFAGVWTLTEWLRGWVLTGLPWLALGYAQTPPSPLAGFVPLLGVYGAGLLTAGVAAWLAGQWRRPLAWLAVIALLGIGQSLRYIEWSQPVGEPVTVSLLQGNVPQSLKWAPEHLALSLETYARLADEHPAQIIVLPETAIPLPFDEIPRDFLHKLTAHGDALIGSVLALSDQNAYVNSAVALTPGLDMQVYVKTHLVPFGEYIPPGFSWFFRLINMPMGSLNTGPPEQKPLVLAGQRVMPNICYEDLFGEEIAAKLSDARLLINLSNTAWFGDSLAQPQHLQIARMRALETARPILRATNTGMTAAIAPDGRVITALPPFTSGALTVSVYGYTGATPYVRIGNWAIVLLALAACLPAVLSGQRKRRQAR
jgi:apolipoprotein N-acyltransferase